MLKTAIMKTPLYPMARSAYQAVFNRGAMAHRARMGAFYSQFFQPGARVFDVGANQGEYSEIFAGEGGRVLAIEPNTAYTDRLKALARTNSIEPVFTAIGDAPGEATLSVCSTPGFSTLVDRKVDWIETSPDRRRGFRDQRAARHVLPAPLSELRVRRTPQGPLHGVPGAPGRAKLQLPADRRAGVSLRDAGMDGPRRSQDLARWVLHRTGGIRRHVRAQALTISVGLQTRSSSRAGQGALR
jgi:FkbM family methyltransferase